jgi:hypothetical protein
MCLRRADDADYWRQACCLLWRRGTTGNRSSHDAASQFELKILY